MEACEIGFEGYAIGGLAVGEPKEERLKVLETTQLPEMHPRYLMGVGTPEDIIEAVAAGMTCSIACCPRNAQRLAFHAPRRHPDPQRAIATTPAPLDEDCTYTCRSYTRLPTTWTRRRRSSGRGSTRCTTSTIIRTSCAIYATPSSTEKRYRNGAAHARSRKQL